MKNKTIIIAEAGVNHNGDLKMLLKKSFMTYKQTYSQDSEVSL